MINRPVAGQAGFVANMSDIAPRHAGRLFGLCNTFGSLAGILGVAGGRPTPVAAGPSSRAPARLLRTLLLGLLIVVRFRLFVVFVVFAH